MKAILDRIPDNQNYYLTIDADGVDPTIMPAVAGPAPGGVNYSQMRKNSLEERLVFLICFTKKYQSAFMNIILILKF